MSMDSGSKNQTPQVQVLVLLWNLGHLPQVAIFCFNFFICKMGIIIVSISQSCYEDKYNVLRTAWLILSAM